jgi:hypothetical protein
MTPNDEYSGAAEGDGSNERRQTPGDDSRLADRPTDRGARAPRNVD